MSDRGVLDEDVNTFSIYVLGLGFRVRISSARIDDSWRFSDDFEVFVIFRCEIDRIPGDVSRSGDPSVVVLGEECVSPKEFSVFDVVGRVVVVLFRGGRGVMCKESKHQIRNFDVTRGYLVESTTTK